MIMIIIISSIISKKLVDQQDESLAISSSELQKEGGGAEALFNDALMNSDFNAIYYFNALIIIISNLPYV